MARKMSVIEAAYRATGSYRRAGKIGAFVSGWGITRRRLGRTPTIDEYAAEWGIDRATAFREQQLFRETFPKLKTPDPILDRLEAEQAVESVDFDGLRVA